MAEVAYTFAAGPALQGPRAPGAKYFVAALVLIRLKLILTVHDLLESFEHKHRVDIGVLDFSKAFDTVPHPHLLKKLQHLGIHGDLYHWLTSFLTHSCQHGTKKMRDVLLISLAFT